jgi:hypothetical protein
MELDNILKELRLPLSTQIVLVQSLNTRVQETYYYIIAFA